MMMELFKELNNIKQGEKISVLEVGAAPETNFKYSTGRQWFLNWPSSVCSTQAGEKWPFLCYSSTFSLRNFAGFCSKFSKDFMKMESFKRAQ